MDRQESAGATIYGDHDFDMKEVKEVKDVKSVKKSGFSIF